MSQETKLAEGSLSIIECIVMGVSGTSPAFSAAATTAALVAAVGIYAPSSALFCGLIMFGVTFSFMYLNRLSANAGASYGWISKIFGKELGFFTGWSLLVASAIFMVSGTIPVATSTLALLKPELVGDPTWVTLVASGWLTLISFVVLRGIKSASYLQLTFTILEICIMIVIIIAAFMTYIKQPYHAITLDIFNPFNYSLELFAKGAIISLFFFWGWDVTVNLSEESKNSSSTPGKAAMWSMLIVTALFVTFLMCALVALSDEEIKNSSTNVLLALANKILPAPWGNIALISVIVSSLGTIETSILQFTRTLFAQSRDGVLHERWAKVHPVWKTPWAATLLIWALGMGFLVIASQEASITSIIDISINVISFQVAFYYGLCGLACAWCQRGIAFKDIPKTIFLIIWPILSAVVLIAIDLYGAIYIFDAKSVLLGIGGILFGVIPLLLNRRKASTRVRAVNKLARTAS